MSLYNIFNIYSSVSKLFICFKTIYWITNNEERTEDYSTCNFNKLTALWNQYPRSKIITSQIPAHIPFQFLLSSKVSCSMGFYSIFFKVRVYYFMTYVFHSTQCLCNLFILHIVQVKHCYCWQVLYYVAMLQVKLHLNIVGHLGSFKFWVN